MVADKALIQSSRVTFQLDNPKTKTLKLNTMKKIIYLLLFSIASSITFTACTEEEITPNTELSGGSGLDPKRR
jgi:hypothetical protein